MKKAALSLGMIVVIVMLGTPASAGQDLLNSVAKGCEKELQGYCKNVTPGQGRILACLYAHSDKLSGKCEYALYDAAVQLERAVAALTYVANECMDDLESLCSQVPAGQGRLISCLNENKEKVSDRCKSAIQDVASK
jgi:hypothetical protein